MFNKAHIYFLLTFVPSVLLCQVPNFVFRLSKTNVVCNKGAAGMQVDSLRTIDTLEIAWSNGQTSSSIYNLDEGNYSVHVTIKSLKDTTINFKIDKEPCPVIISNHFTPNGDNYNDTWHISNIDNYPKFELYVFNKWGQQIHSQKGNYTPWDGNWNGIKVPDGTYYYVFYYESGKKDLIKGDVTVLR